MNQFDLSSYRFPPLEYLLQEHRFEREKFLMQKIQIFFEGKNSKEQVSLGYERDEHICLQRHGELLAIYFSEKGGKNLIALFVSIYQAIDFLSYRCLDLPPSAVPEIRKSGISRLIDLAVR